MFPHLRAGADRPAAALGQMCEKPAQPGMIPEWALEDYEYDETDDLDADETIADSERD